MSSVNSKSGMHGKSAEPPAPRRCLVCMEEANLKACSRCHNAYYCSAAHQKEHWKTHKVACIPKNIPVPKNIPKEAPQVDPPSSPAITADTYLGRCDGSGSYFLYGFFHTGTVSRIINLCIRLGHGKDDGLINGVNGPPMPRHMVDTETKRMHFIDLLMAPALFTLGDPQDLFGSTRKRKMYAPISAEFAKSIVKHAGSNTSNPPVGEILTSLQLFLALRGDECSEEESQFRKFVERSAESEAVSPGPLGGEKRFSEIVYVLQSIRGEYRSMCGFEEDLDLVLGPPPYRDMPPLPNANSDAASHNAMFQWVMNKVSSVRSVYERQERICRHMSMWHYLMKEPRCAALLWHCAEGMTSDCYMSPWLRAQVLKTPLDVGGQEYIFEDGPYSPVAGVFARLQSEVERLFGYEEHAI